MIGVFDSGIGGLTVLRELSAQLPGYDMLYLGDTARSPYGSKSAETVSRFTLECVELLLRQGVRLVVLACHAAAGVAMKRLQSSVRVPIFDTAAPAVDSAVAQSRSLRIGVMADYSHKKREPPDLCGASLWDRKKIDGSKTLAHCR
jgi:glutamate racemase